MDETKEYELGRACSTHVKKINVYRDLVGKPEGEKPLGRRIRRWVNNIKMVLREIEWVVWTGLFWLSIGTSGGLFSQ
jgi:hypothetical protein